MNKRGFSLVELLAVVSILAIIAFIVSVPITKNIKEGNEKACRSQFNSIIEAAKLWGNENVNLLPNDTNKKGTIKIATLKKDGFLSDDLQNPVTKEKISNDLIIYIEKVGNKRWNYTLDEEVVEDYCKNIPIDEQDPVILPIYSVNPSGDVWARSKKVTITYPERKDNYIYQYIVDGLDDWTTVNSGTTVNLEFIKDSNVTARIYDGVKYHTASTLSVNKIDRMSPMNVSAVKAGSTTKSITVKANGTDGESGIGKYEFSKDNGTTWVSNGTSSTYTFTNLKSGAYQVKVRVTDKVGNATTSAAVSMSTSTVTVPTYSVSPSGDVWAKSKTVTITYPTRQTGFVYQYSVNGGSAWTTVSSGTTATYTFTANGNIIARIYDGVNYFSASSLSVTKIGENGPIENGRVIYLNPQTGKICNDYVNSNSLNENKTGCLKWYTFDGNNESENINLLLDHNTTYTVAYNSDNVNTEMKEIKVELDNLVTISKWVYVPRLITADEVAKIVKHPTFNSVTSDNGDWFYFDTLSTSKPSLGIGESKYKWLFNYTKGCVTDNKGCDVEDNVTRGYWTSSRVYTESVWDIWRVDRGGLGMNACSIDDQYGVRPVITVSKSIIS